MLNFIAIAIPLLAKNRRNTIFIFSLFFCLFVPFFKKKKGGISLEIKIVPYFIIRVVSFRI